MKKKRFFQQAIIWCVYHLWRDKLLELYNTSNQYLLSQKSIVFDPYQMASCDILWLKSRGERGNFFTGAKWDILVFIP